VAFVVKFLPQSSQRRYTEFTEYAILLIHF
jgi:hypothetical protein